MKRYMKRTLLCTCGCLAALLTTACNRPKQTAARTETVKTEQVRSLMMEPVEIGRAHV